MAKNKWTREITIQLIQMLEQRENLWNKKSPDYENWNKRINSVVEVSDLLGMSTGAVEKKLHSLRCKYRSERKKEDTSSAGTGEKYVSQWEFYDSLHFLHEGDPINKPGEAMDLEYNTLEMEGINKESASSSI